MGELPLLLGAIEIGVLMIEMPESLLEPCLGRAADECMDERGAQVSVPLKKFEYLDIARREFDSLSGSRSVHSRSA